LSLQEQESVILEDLLFVFMGIEGQYVRFAEAYDPGEEKDRLAGPVFSLLPGLDPSLRDLTSTMLNLATHYVALEAFIEVQSREEFGSVNHALCAAIRKILKDHLVLVAQLEHEFLTNEGFTLHVLNLHIKPTSQILWHLFALAQEILKNNALLQDGVDSLDDMDDIENIIESLREGATTAGNERKVCKGGAVLGLISKRLSTMSGDPAAKHLLSSLLRDASRPYMKMLNEWLHHGGIKDPHSEFLIKEQRSIRREGLEQDYTDEYWEKRYTIRESDVPPQLAAVQEKVLLAGKYLNVVRECGGIDTHDSAATSAPSSFSDPLFLENIHSAYAHANASLLNLLLTTHALPARLRSLKHYFFLDRSDFFTHFLGLSASELRKPARGVNVGKLQSLLDIVLRQPGSVAAEDPFKEDVRVQINEMGLTTWLMRVVNVTGIDSDSGNNNMNSVLANPMSTNSDDKDISGFEALVLDYAVPFPLSLVVSRVTLIRYQLLFRYLLSLRHLETLLVASWAEHAKLPVWQRRSGDRRIEHWKRRAWTLRSRMLDFVQQLMYFSTSEVIEPNWQAFMARLSEGGDSGGGLATGKTGAPKRTVDELMQDHIDFLATCLKECMLTNARLLKVRPRMALALLLTPTNPRIKQINSRIMNTCTHFAKYTTTFSRHLAAADTQTGATPEAATAAAAAAIDPAKLARLVDDLDKFEASFSKHLKTLLGSLNYLAATETVVFLGLCARLSNKGDGGPGSGLELYA